MAENATGPDHPPMTSMHLVVQSQPGWVHYLPLATTVLAAFFAAALFRRYLDKGGFPHLAWWAVGQ